MYFYQQDNGYSNRDIRLINQHTMEVFSLCFPILQTEFVDPLGIVVLTIVLDSSQGISRSHEDNALFITSYNNITSNDEGAEGHEMEGK